MLNSTKILLTTALLATTLTACDKKEPAKLETTSTTVEKTVTADSTPTPISTVASVTSVTDSATTPTAVESATTKTEVKETSVKETPAQETLTAPATVATTISSPSVKFPAPSGKSIVTQTVKSGTPEATVKAMMDAMMTGTPAQVASYYGVADPTLEPMLAEQQPIVQQQAKSLQLGDVEYNKDKSKAIIVGKMTLNNNTSNNVGYKLQKINGQWKLMP